MLIEDVAVPVERLGAMTMDLIEMFQRHGYKDASCFGHALEGNLHLVFSQGFRTAAEVERYDNMMQELCSLVAEKHGGSLKAEHGTGRNVAPFVEMEWGPTAYALMWQLKELFDPDYVLNPGVILNADPDVHKKNLKPSPPASPLVDRCIECGFCESNCPSRDVTLTPRQRITVYREISRLRALPSRSGEDEARLKEFTTAFDYLGTSTCAADGMCQQKCPVSINTGDLVKHLRAEELKKDTSSTWAAMQLAKNFSTTVTAGQSVRAGSISAVNGPLTVAAQAGDLTGLASGTPDPLGLGFGSATSLKLR
jgi:D-lactate dehydrogenase